MRTFSKTLELDDYNILCAEKEWVEGIQFELVNKGVEHRYEHEHRAWEYAMAIQAILTHHMWLLPELLEKRTTILDVGGGGSVFAPSMATALDARVLQIDPQPVGHNIAAQAKALSLNLDFIHGDFVAFYPPQPFDVVVCLSVIEHVVDHIQFFYHLMNCTARNGLLFLTTDFSMDGLPKCPHHLRTYAPGTLQGMLSLASAKGFTVFGGEPDWKDTGQYVNGYNFASLALRRFSPAE